MDARRRWDEPGQRREWVTRIGRYGLIPYLFHEGMIHSRMRPRRVCNVTMILFWGYLRRNILILVGMKGTVSVAGPANGQDRHPQSPLLRHGAADTCHSSIESKITAPRHELPQAGWPHYAPRSHLYWHFEVWRRVVWSRCNRGRRGCICRHRKCNNTPFGDFLSASNFPRFAITSPTRSAE